MFWIVISIIAAVEIAIIAYSLKMRVMPVQTHGLIGARPAEVLWSLLPAILLVALFLLSSP